MYVDWVLITYLDQSELLLKRTGTFEDHLITSIEINEENNLIKASVDNENIVSYPMANMISYTYSRLHEIE
ncbi:MAG: hypothetical protein WAK14_01575 [Methanobacterium sp.]|jgi:hypothetical protein